MGTKVTGHATEADVEQGGVRAEDKFGMLKLTLLQIWGGVISLWFACAERDPCFGHSFLKS